MADGSADNDLGVPHLFDWKGNWCKMILLKKSAADTTTNPSRLGGE
jgi:hypothetical protein